MILKGRATMLLDHLLSPENTSPLSFAPHCVNIADELLNNNNRSHARVSVRL